MSEFPSVVVNGDAVERGNSHGEQLRERIHATRDFYRDIFRMPEADVRERAAQFAQQIRAFNSDYADEIEGIAAAAKIEPHWIYAMNSRTELLSLTPAGGLTECTSLYFRPTSIQGQTWDWGKRLQELLVVMRIEQPDGHAIQMIAEPGIIGKIGMNSAGIGTCLNLLRIGQLSVGVPVHIMLRAILDSRSHAEARQVVERAAGGKASNILVGDGNGNGFAAEFAADRVLFHEPDGATVTHTNHYLKEPGLDESEFDLSSSRCRLDVANQRVDGLSDYGFDQMVGVLSDRSRGPLSILRRYLPHEMVEHIGTVCTVIMELAEGRFHVRPGNDASTPFQVFEVATSQ